MRYNKWHLWIGVIIGAITPLIAFNIIYSVQFVDAKWMNVTDLFKSSPDVIRPMVQLSVLPNLALFFLFIMFNMDRVSRGILLSTIIYGLYVLYITFIA